MDFIEVKEVIRDYLSQQSPNDKIFPSDIIASFDALLEYSETLKAYIGKVAPLWSSDSIEVPTTNATYFAADVNTGANVNYSLPLTGGGTQVVTVLKEELIQPDGNFDRVELRFNKESNTWIKVPIEKRPGITYNETTYLPNYFTKREAGAKDDSLVTVPVPGWCNTGLTIAKPGDKLVYTNLPANNAFKFYKGSIYDGTALQFYNPTLPAGSGEIVAPANTSYVVVAYEGALNDPITVAKVAEKKDIPKDIYDTADKTYYLSRSGCFDDSVLFLGEEIIGTDATLNIQALLNTATKHNPITVVVDGRYSIRQLKIKSYTTIVALEGCGFVQIPKVQKTMLVNYNRQGTKTGLNITDRSITLDNLILNGTGWYGEGFGKDKKSIDDGGSYVYICRFAGVEKLTVKNIKFFNPRTYCSFVNNCKDVLYQDIDIKISDTTTFGNFDGCDFVGPMINLTVRNLAGQTKDDLIGLATSYGWQSDDPNREVEDGGVMVNNYDVYASCGHVFNVLVDNATMRDTYQGFRVMSVDSVSVIDSVVYRGLNGSILQNCPLMIDNFLFSGSPTDIWHPNGGTTGNVKNLIFSDINLNLNSADVFPFVIGLKAECITFNNLTIKTTGLYSRNDFFTFLGSTNIKRLVFNNVTFEDATGNVGNVFYLSPDATIGSIEMTNVKVVKTTGAGINLLGSGGGSTVGKLTISGADLQNAYAFSNGGNLSSIQLINTKSDMSVVGGTSVTVPFISLYGHIGTPAVNGPFATKKGELV